MSHGDSPLNLRQTAMLHGDSITNLRRGIRIRRNKGMKRVLLMEFLASGTRRNPVMKDITGFEFPDLRNYYEDDPVYYYLKKQGCEAVPFFVARTRGRMYVETFWQIVSRLEAALETVLKDGPIDGIWFYTYALSAVDFIGNGEEFMLKIIRNKIGYEVPISIAMDFHGLITPNVARMVNIVSTFRTNPHTDVTETRLRAARLLVEALKHGNPEITSIQIPVLGVDSTRMDVGAGAQVVKCLEQLEELPGVVSAALVTGIVWNNVSEGTHLFVDLCISGSGQKKFTYSDGSCGKANLGYT